MKWVQVWAATTCTLPLTVRYHPQYGTVLCTVPYRTTVLHVVPATQSHPKGSPCLQYSHEVFVWLSICAVSPVVALSCCCSIPCMCCFCSQFMCLIRLGRSLGCQHRCCSSFLQQSVGDCSQPFIRYGSILRHCSQHLPHVRQMCTPAAAVLLQVG